MTEDKDKKTEEKKEPKVKTFQEILEQISKDRMYMISVFMQCLDATLSRGKDIDYNNQKISEFIGLSNELQELYEEYNGKYPAFKVKAEIKLQAYLKHYGHIFRGFIHKAQKELKIFYEPKEVDEELPIYDDFTESDETDSAKKV